MADASTRREGMDDEVRIETWAVAAQDGDLDAFQHLVLAVQQELRLWLAWRLGDGDLVEDVMQETLLAAWNARATYEPGGDWRSWLRGIARHRAERALRAEWRHRRRRVDDLDRLLLADRAAELAAEADRAADDRRGMLERLGACLGRLTPAARALVEARYREGADLATLAGRLGRSAGSLASALCRIRSQLADCLGGART